MRIWLPLSRMSRAKASAVSCPWSIIECASSAKDYERERQTENRIAITILAIVFIVVMFAAIFGK